jgi:hypothetical protein
MDTICRKHAGRKRVGLMAALLMLSVTYSCTAQTQSTDSSAPHEMIVTGQGFIAIDTPKGWEQSKGPGLAFFLPKGVDPQKTDVWIYINSAPVGPNEEDKDAQAYIQSDIAGFRQRFKNGTVRKEDTLLLPEVKQQAAVYTFLSGEENNAFEQIIYVADVRRVLIFALSAKNSAALNKSVSVFHEFAKSYRGSIQMGSTGDTQK